MSSPNRPPGSRLTWTPDDLGNFVDQVHDDRFCALWMLIATTGVPLESLAALGRDDVDFEKRSVHPQPTALSGGEGRTRLVRRSYGLDPTAYDALKDHVVAWKKERNVLRQETQRLFVWSNGEQVDAGAVRTMFRQHCSLAGLPVVPLEAMRNAYAMAAIASGIPVRVLSERLRNSTLPQNLRVPPRHDDSGVARWQGIDESWHRGL